MYLQTGLDRLDHFLKRTELFNKSKAYYQFERWFRLLEKHVFNFSSSTLLSDFCALCKLDIHGLLINFRIIFHLHFESINEQSNYSDFCALEWYCSPTWIYVNLMIYNSCITFTLISSEVCSLTIELWSTSYFLFFLIPYTQTSVHWSDTLHLLGLRQPVDLHQDETELPLFSAQQVQLIARLRDFQVQSDFFTVSSPKTRYWKIR